MVDSNFARFAVIWPNAEACEPMKRMDMVRNHLGDCLAVVVGEVFNVVGIRAGKSHEAIQTAGFLKHCERT